MKRAYSLLEIKGIDEERREIEGIATTPTPDRMGDIVEPRGAQFRLPLPLLWQHMGHQPIGEVFAAKPTKDGIPISARIFKASRSRTLVERLDEAWESIAIGLVKGLSIGFSPLEMEPIKDTFSFVFKKWEWLELSAVTIPANSEATIENVKSIDQAVRAASGQRTPVVTLDKSILRRVRRKPGAVYLDPFKE